MKATFGVDVRKADEVSELKGSEGQVKRMVGKCSPGQLLNEGTSAGPISREKGGSD